MNSEKTYILEIPFSLGIAFYYNRNITFLCIPKAHRFLS